MSHVSPALQAYSLPTVKGIVFHCIVVLGLYLVLTNKTQLSEVGVAILNKIIDKLIFSWEVGQVYFKFSIP